MSKQQHEYRTKNDIMNNIQNYTNVDIALLIEVTIDLRDILKQMHTAIIGELPTKQRRITSH